MDSDKAKGKVSWKCSSAGVVPAANNQLNQTADPLAKMHLILLYWVYVNKIWMYKNNTDS